MSDKFELPTDDTIYALDVDFEEWWKFFKGTQGLKDDSLRVYVGVWNFARCVWLAAQQDAHAKAIQAIQAQCNAKGTGCLAHCTHPESIEAIRTLDWERLVNEPDADCPVCGARPLQMHKADCPQRGHDLPTSSPRL